jgi:hypothetical protein
MVKGRVASGGINTDLCLYNEGGFFRISGVTDRNIVFTDGGFGAILSGPKVSLVEIDESQGLLKTVA